MLTWLDYCFHVNAYKHLTAKGLPAAVIQSGVKSNPGSCKEALSPKTVSRSCSETLLVSQAPFLLYFTFTVLTLFPSRLEKMVRWLSLLVLVSRFPQSKVIESYRTVCLTPFCKLANERYWDQYHHSTATSVPGLPSREALTRSSPVSKLRMRLKHRTKIVSGLSIYTDYASSATF